MSKYKVPYSVIITGELECEAASVTQANVHARRWLSSQGIEVHKTLMEMGAGRVRIHGNDITKMETGTHQEWDGQRFTEEKD